MSLTVAGATALAAGLAAAGQAAAIGGQAAANSRVAKLQNQFNIDMWNRTNEYNSPQAQMRRLSEAGLNPNLIYGNVNTGNTSPAQQVAPQAPDIQRGIEELTHAFNVENLLTMDANRQAAEADAKLKKIAAANAFDLRRAQHDFGELWSFNPKTGQFEFVTPDVTVQRAMSPAERRLYNETGAVFNTGYNFDKVFSDYYRNLHLIPYRAALYEHQKRYLAPQIQMLRYQSEYYPYSYWIDNVNRGTGALKNLFTLPLPF